MKNVYGISIRSIQTYETFIEAESKEEAHELAEKIMSYNNIPVVFESGNPANEELYPKSRTIVIQRESMSADELKCLAETQEVLEEIADESL